MMRGLDYITITTQDITMTRYNVVYTLQSVPFNFKPCIIIFYVQIKLLVFFKNLGTYLNVIGI